MFKSLRWKENEAKTLLEIIMDKTHLFCNILEWIIILLLCCFKELSHWKTSETPGLSLLCLYAYNDAYYRVEQLERGELWVRHELYGQTNSFLIFAINREMPF